MDGKDNGARLGISNYSDCVGNEGIVVGADNVVCKEDADFADGSYGWNMWSAGSERIPSILRPVKFIGM